MKHCTLEWIFSFFISPWCLCDQASCTSTTWFVMKTLIVFVRNTNLLSTFFLLIQCVPNYKSYCVLTLMCPTPKTINQTKILTLKCNHAEDSYCRIHICHTSYSVDWYPTILLSGWHPIASVQHSSPQPNHSKIQDLNLWATFQKYVKLSSCYRSQHNISVFDLKMIPLRTFHMHTLIVDLLSWIVNCVLWLKMYAII